jgi:hypothetical protein
MTDTTIDQAAKDVCWALFLAEFPDLHAVVEPVFVRASAGGRATETGSEDFFEVEIDRDDDAEQALEAVLEDRFPVLSTEVGDDTVVYSGSRPR